MATSLGRLVIDIAANAAGFSTDMKRVSRAAQTEMRKVSRELRFAQMDLDKANAKLSQMATRIAALGAISLGLVVREFRNLSQEADRIQKISIATGLTAEAVQELGFAAEQSGSNLEAVIKGVQQLQKNIVQAQDGLATYVRAFERVGIAVEDLDGLSPEEQFLRMAEALARVEDPTVRTATAMELLGRAGKELIPFLAKGADGIEELRQQMRATGSVMSQETVDAAARFNDAMNLLGRQVKSLSITLFSDLIQRLAELADFFARTSEGQEQLRILMERLGSAAKVLGAVIGVSLVASLGRAVIGVITAQVRVGQLTAQKLALAGASRTAAVSIAVFGRAVAIATGPIGIAIALLGTFALGYREVKRATDLAAGSVGTFNERVERLLENQRLGALQPLIEEFAAGAAEIVRLNREIAETQALINDPDAFRGATDARIAPEFRAGLIRAAKEELASLRAELERTTGNTAAVSKAIEDLEKKLKSLREEEKKATGEKKKLAGENKKLAAEVARVRIELEDMADALSGDVAKATRQYARDVDRIVGVLVKAGASQEEINDAVDTARKRFLDAVTPADEFAEQIERILEAAQRANVDPLLEQILQLQIALEGITDPARIAELERAIEILSGVRPGRPGVTFQQTLGRNLAQSIVFGTDIVDGLGRAFRASGSEVIGDALQGLFSSSLDKAFSQFEFSDEAKQAIAAGFAVAIGQAISGDVTGAALTAAGTAIGAVIGTVVFPALGTAAGAAIGGALGSLLGNLFGGSKNPRFILGGDIGFGGLGRNLDEQFGTILGSISANFRNLDRETERTLIRGLREFDLTIATMVRDVGQLSQIEQALREFEFNSNQQGASIEDLLEARFDVILSTFDQFTQALVRQGFTLDEQVQRLSDVLGIQRIIGEGEGFADFERTIEIIQQLGFVGESLGETFVRLNQAFANYAGIVLKLEEDIQLTPLNDFQRELIQIQRQLIRNIDALNKAAKAAGLQAAREEDLARAHEAAAVAVQRAVARLEESTRSLVEQLFGTALTRIRDQIRAIEEAAVDVGGAADQASSGLARLRDQLIRFADSLLVGSLSPLPSRERLGEAQRLLREASSRGDVSAVQQFAQSVLQIAQARFGSGQPFTDIFNEVQKIIRGTTPREDIQSVSVVSAPGISAELAALFEEERRLEQEAEDRRNQLLALDIAQAVADLSEATGREFSAIADSLGFVLADLASVLGLDVDELNDFIEGLKIDTGEFANQLEELSRGIITAIVEGFETVARDPFEPPGFEVPGSTGFEPQFDKIVTSTDGTTTAVDAAAAAIVTQLRDSDSGEEIKSLLRRIADGVESRSGRSDRTRALSS